MNELDHSEMKRRLKEYIDTIFADTPHGRRVDELREELTQNLWEKYDDLIADGRTPAAAYNAAISGVGDVSGLLAEVAKTDAQETAAAPTPEPSAPAEEKNSPDETSREPLLSPPITTDDHAGTGRATRLRMNDTDRKAVRHYYLRHAIMTAVAVALYIFSVIFPILFDGLEELTGLAFLESLGVTGMFGCIAIATVLIIVANASKPAVMQERNWHLGLGLTPPDQARAIMRSYRARASVITTVAVVLYITCWIPSMVLSYLPFPFLTDTVAPMTLFAMVALATGLLVFNSMSKPLVMRFSGLIGTPTEGEEAPVENHPDAQRDLRRQTEGRRSNKVYKAISGALWVLTVMIYLAVSLTFGGWTFTWIIFLICVALDNIIEAIFDLCE